MTSRISYFQLLLYTDTNSLFNPSGNIKMRGVFSRFSARLEAGQRGGAAAAGESFYAVCRAENRNGSSLAVTGSRAREEARYPWIHKPYRYIPSS